MNFKKNENRYNFLNELIDLEQLAPSDDVFNEWINRGHVISKDIRTGDVLILRKILERNDSIIKVLTDNYVTIDLDIKKEKKYFKYCYGLNQLDNILDYIDENSNSLQDVRIQITETTSAPKASIFDCYINDLKQEFYEQIKLNEKIYDAKIISKNDGGFFIDVKGVELYMPGSLASANKIVNFESMIGKNINVMIEDYLPSSDTFIASNKKYLTYMLPNKIKKLDITKKYKGIVTGSVVFGLFVEFDDMLTGLLHHLDMEHDFFKKFRNKDFEPGSEIEFFIKSIDENNKILLTTKEENVNLWNEFKTIYEGVDLEGTIKNINDYGIFVNFTHKNKIFLGLLLKNKIPSNFSKNEGDNMLFHIQKVLPKDEKIFLNFSL